MSSTSQIENSRYLIPLLIGILLGGQAAQYLGLGSFFYATIILMGGLYVARHSSQALWAGFFLLAVTAQVYPVGVDESGVAFQGAFRPYILAITVVAVAMLIALWARASRGYKRAASADSSMRWPIAAFVAVLFLTLAHGYFASTKLPTLWEVIRQCSGWMTFLFFLVLGYRLSISSDEIQRAFTFLRLATLVYSVFFIAEYLRVWMTAGPLPASLFANSQRDAMFFSGVVLAILVVQEVAPETKPASRKIWLTVIALLLAILLCGSRSVLGSVVLVTLAFVLAWHAKTRLRLGLLAAVGVLVVLFGYTLTPTSLFDSDDSLLGSLTKRFLSSPTEDTSFLARGSEMLAVAEAVRDNPLFGRGPFASYSFFDPIYGWLDTTFVDSGVGYLLMKTGLLGMGIFLWFGLAWLKMVRRLRRSIPASAIPLLASFAFYLVFLPFGPSFFEFQHSWFIGLVVGQAVQMASRLPVTGSAQVPSALCQRGAVA